MEGDEDLLQGIVCMNLSLDEGARAALVANGEHWGPAQGFWVV